LETITFAELGLSAKVLEAITSAGYTIPTPIQAKAIPIALTGRDVLGIAQTGTGKTASFTLPMISRLETGRARARMPRSLILAPTRELAAQVAQSFEKYGVNHKLDVALLIGGVSMDEQTRKLERGVDVLIATPGRLLDHFQRGRILLMGVEILVIDEADRMLDMGFIPDIEKICKLLPPARQTLFFSATMPPEITRLVHTFMRDPERIEAAPPATTAKTIIQQFIYTPSGEDWDKREMLRGLLRSEGVRNAIIFCNRKVDVAILHKSLVKHGFNAGALHGDMEQRDRMATLDKFRAGEIAFLVASDVAARGLDIPDVSHVFNYDLPRDKDDYVHRIGRTGRAGKEGHATSIVAPMDLKQFLEIQKMTKVDATWIGDAPTDEDYAEAGKRKRGRGAPAGRPAAGRPASGRPTAQAAAPHGGRGQGGRNGAPAGDARRNGNGSHDGGRPRPVAEVAALDADVVATDVVAARPERARGNRPPMDRDPALDGNDRGHGDRRPRSRQRDGRRDGRQDSRPPRDAVAPVAAQPRAEPRSEPRIEAAAPRAPAQPRAVAPVKPQVVQSHAVPHPAAKPQPAAAVQPPSGNDRRPRPSVRDSGRGQGQPRPEVAARERARPQQGPVGGDARSGGGFADNLPAFLRRPPRPAKAASDN
jgi:superfamily II DNA/RNA helicase